MAAADVEADVLRGFVPGDHAEGGFGDRYGERNGFLPDGGFDRFGGRGLGLFGEDDGIDGDGSLSSLSVTNDKLSLATTNGDL